MSIIEPHIETEKYSRYYHELFQNSTDVIYLIAVTQDGRFIHLDINNAYVDATGIPKESIVGRYVDELENDEFREILQRKYGSCVKAGERTTFIADYSLPSGIRTYHSALTPIRDESGRIHRLVGVARDITDQKKSELALIDSQTRLQAIIENEPECIKIIDAEGRLSYMNPAGLEMIEATLEQVQGKEVLGVIVEKYRNDFIQMHRRVIAGEKAHLIFETIGLRGKHCWLETTSVPMSIEGRPVLLGVTRDITERKKQEEHLQRTRTKLHAVISTIPDLIWVKDAQGVYMLCNPAFERFFGAECGEILGKTDYDFISREQADFFRQKDREAMEAGEMRINEEEIVFAVDGRQALLETRKIPVYHGGEFMGVLGIGRDITEKRRAEREIVESSEFIRSILGALPDLLFEVDRNGVYINVWANDPSLLAAQKELLLGRTINEVFDPANAAVCMDAIRIADEKGKCAGHQITIDFPSGRRWFELSISKISTREGHLLVLSRDITDRKHYEIELALSNEKFRTIAENTRDTIARYDRYCRRTYANSAFAALAGKSPEALLGAKPTDYVDSPQSRAYEAAVQRAFQSGNDEMFEFSWPDASGKIITSHIHIVPEKDAEGEVYSVLATGRDITSQKEAERNLKTLTEALNASSESIFLVDLQSACIAYVNETACRTLGYSRTELLGGMRVFDIDPDFSPQLWEVHVDDLLNLGHLTIETRHQNKNGHIYPVEVVAHYFEYEGKEYNLAVTRDITEKKAYEDALHAREREFRTIAENSPDVIIRYNLAGERIYINPIGEKLFGRRASEIIGKKATELSPIPAEIAFMDKFYEVIRTGEAVDTETEFTIPTGEKGWGHMRIVPEFNHNGAVISVLTIGRDITERKRNEERLQYKEERLREAQQIAKIGSWELEFPGLNLSWSDEIYRIFEIDPNITLPSYDHFLNAIHPDDREYVDQIYSESVEQKIPYDVIHRLLMRDGRIKYVHERALTTYDPDGTPIRTVGTVQDITEQKKTEKKIEHMAMHDALTGLPNRLLAKERMENAIRYAHENDTKAALLFIDLDGFKTINDTLGHSVGDMMLKQVANRLRVCTRSLDTLCRLGGDEFLLILSGIESRENVVIITQKILDVFAVPLDVLHHQLPITMSIGVALYPDHGNHFEALLQKSDTAMYKAKDSGKNTYCFYSEQMKHTLIGEFKIHNDMRQALNEGQFLLHYQPQVDLQHKQIFGAEALIRWKHPQLGMVPPMQFISIAENNGMIVQIGEWVIRETCRQIAQWHRNGIRISIAVNISSVQFKRGNLFAVVQKALRDTGIDPSFLELELTESIMMQDTQATLEVVKQLKGLGLQLSIDDFGTGYSSLAYLKRFTVDKLKIDQSFVRDIVQNTEDAIIVQAIVQMAKSLNLKTIAEGVENQEALELIESFGCEEVQGYHFAKPMDVQSFENYHRTFNFC